MDNQLTELAARVDALSDLVRATNQHSPAPDYSHALEALQEDLAALKAAQRQVGPDVISREVHKQVTASMRQIPAAVAVPIRERINAVQKIAENAAVDARREAEVAMHSMNEIVRRSLAAHELKATMAVATLRAFITEELT